MFIIETLIRASAVVVVAWFVLYAALSAGPKMQLAGKILGARLLILSLIVMVGGLTEPLWKKPEPVYQQMMRRMPGQPWAPGYRQNPPPRWQFQDTPRQRGEPTPQKQALPPAYRPQNPAQPRKDFVS